MLLLALGKHLIWSRTDSNGGTSYYYYYDAITWIVGALAMVWLTWFLLRSYLRARALRRRPRQTDKRSLSRIVKLKRELSSRYLLPGFSANIHAVGVGKLAGGNEHCIQVFVTDANSELWAGSGTAFLPNNYRGVPVVLIEMPAAGLLSEAPLISPTAVHQYPKGIREPQEVIIGGISAANSNLTGQSGTIGYFCTRKSRFQRRKEIHLLSNSHVFADLRKAKVDDTDLIMQPSPGEPASNRPIGTLANYSALKFDNVNEPNHVDAAIARLLDQQPHKLVVPLIGAVTGYVDKNDIEVGETVRKFGRTTGYTEGTILSIYLDIWVRYDRTGQQAFFRNQFLIEPALPSHAKFVSKGDSGSLVVDARQHAIGLIFAGTSEGKQPTEALPKAGGAETIDSAGDKPKRIEGYGVANPISEVLDRLKIELVV